MADSFRKSELVFGVREARKNFAHMIDQIEDGTPVVYLTRGGRRVAALVEPSFAGSSTLPGEIAQIPRSTRNSAQLIETMLTDVRDLMPDVFEQLGERRGELVGELALLMECLYFPLSGNREDGSVMILGDDGKDSGRSISLPELIMPRVFHSRGNGSLFTGEGMSIVAGALWALQMGIDLHEWRNSLRLPISGDELMSWIFATYHLAAFLNVNFGEGFAEDLMYQSDDVARTFRSDNS
ncbi:type II toxin-antitoxin system Phd/YefM family antitoxin [Streptomyces sp. NPDC002623]